MKFLLKLIPILFSAFILFAFTSCGTEDYQYGEDESIENESNSFDENPLLDVTFENVEFVYDGTVKVIQINGTLPEGVTAYYSNNTATNVGEYQATAILLGEGFDTVTLTATLTIIKADITTVEFARDFYVYTPSTAKTVEVSGSIPEGVTVEYSNNYKEEIGTYAVTATLTGENYNTLTLETTLKIVPKISDFSSVITESINSVPKAWTFLPDSLNIFYRFTNENPISYNDFVNIKGLPTNGMGEQLNSVCAILNASQLATATVDNVYPIFNVVSSLYNTYLDTEPYETTFFETDINGYAIILSINNDNYSLSLSKDGITVIVFANTATGEYGTKVTYNQSVTVKYTVTDQNLKIALKATDVMSAQIQVTKEEDRITGTYHQFLGTEDIGIKLSSLFEITDDYSIFIGSKGTTISDETEKQTEIYRNSDGRLVGISNKRIIDLGFLLGKITYNTLYFPIDAVSGIESIKKLETNDLINPYLTYVNNNEKSIKTTTMGQSAGYKANTKKFNIEFKDFYFLSFNSEKEIIEPIAKCLPVIAIQEECLESFENEFNSLNESSFTEPAKLTITDEEKTTLYYGFNTLCKTYDTVKNSVTKTEIDSWCKEL